MNIREICGNYGFFSIEPKDDAGIYGVIKAPGTEDMEFYCSYFSEVQVIQLAVNVYLVSSDNFSIIVRKDENGVTMQKYSVSFEIEQEGYDEEYNNSILFLPREEIEKCSYKATDDLLSQGLIILRNGFDYVLYDFIHDDIITEKCSNIEQVDGKIVVEVCIYGRTDKFDKTTGWQAITYPIDILVGEIDVNGSLVNNELISQKWNVPVSAKNSIEQEYYNVVNGLDKSLERDFDYKEYLTGKGRI